jgi:4-hydroxy-L-threonine phosphate dehydrogenase PdxA
VTRPIALTCGEPAGIGIEIAAKAAAVLRGDPSHDRARRPGA